MQIPTDLDLARQACQGHSAAYGELVQRYQLSVFNVCYRLLGERREAEDLAQEAFVRAWSRLDSYDPQRPFGPWVRRVAANLCINHLQAQRTWLAQTAEALDDEYAGAALGGEPAPGPEAAHLHSEQAELLRRAVQALPPQQRVVLELRHFHDQSYAEIAAQLNLPLSDVKSHLFRARRALAAALQGQIEDRA